MTAEVILEGDAWVALPTGKIGQDETARAVVAEIDRAVCRRLRRPDHPGDCAVGGALHEALMTERAGDPDDPAAEGRDLLRSGVGHDGVIGGRSDWSQQAGRDHETGEQQPKRRAAAGHQPTAADGSIVTGMTVQTQSAAVCSVVRERCESRADRGKPRAGHAGSRHTQARRRKLAYQRPTAAAAFRDDPPVAGAGSRGGR